MDDWGWGKKRVVFAAKTKKERKKIMNTKSLNWLLFFLLLVTFGVLIFIVAATRGQDEERIVVFEETKTEETGYFVEVGNLNVPQDITEIPVARFSLYAKDGKTKIWQENISLSQGYSTDEALELALCRWADQYIAAWERQQALDALTKASKIIGQKLNHKM
jgi:hypothetical protein